MNELINKWPVNFIRIISNEKLNFSESTTLPPKEIVKEIGDELLTTMGEIFNEETLNVLKKIFIEQTKKISDYGFKFTCWWAGLSNYTMGWEPDRLQADQEGYYFYKKLRKAIIEANVKLKAMEYPYSLYDAAGKYPEVTMNERKLKEVTELIRRRMIRDSDTGLDYMAALVNTITGNETVADMEILDTQDDIDYAINLFDATIDGYRHTKILNASTPMLECMLDFEDNVRTAAVELVHYKNSESILDKGLMQTLAMNIEDAHGYELKVSSTDGIIRLAANVDGMDTDSVTAMIEYLSAFDKFETLRCVPALDMYSPHNYVALTTTVDVIAKIEPTLFGNVKGLPNSDDKKLGFDFSAVENNTE